MSSSDQPYETNLNLENFFDSPYINCPNADLAPNDETNPPSYYGSRVLPASDTSSSASDPPTLGSDNSYESDTPSLGSNHTPLGSDTSSAANGPQSLDKSTSYASSGDFLEPHNDEILNNSEGHNDENHTSLDHIQPNAPRKSGRILKLSNRLDGFVLEGKVKYSLDKVVMYSHLKPEIKCFISSLNKGVEPKSFLKALQNKHWVGAMNLELEALNLNGT